MGDVLSFPVLRFELPALDLGMGIELTQLAL